MEHNSKTDVHNRVSHTSLSGDGFKFQGSWKSYEKTQKLWENISHTAGNTQNWDNPCQVATASMMEQWASWVGEVFSGTSDRSHIGADSSAAEWLQWPYPLGQGNTWNLPCEGKSSWLAIGSYLVDLFTKSHLNVLPKSWLATSKLPF